MKKTLPAIQVYQNEKTILVFSIEAKQLMEISYFNPRELDREEGIQRDFKPIRSKEIAKYIDSEDASLPNNIIINLELEKHGISFYDIFDEDNQRLNINKLSEKARNKNRKNKDLKGKIAFVIDGQHRLRAFEFVKRKKFPVIVSAYFDLSLAEVAELFVKINYNQKTVNKSLVLDLLGISKKVFPQYWKLHMVVKRLNEDISSPFCNKIKMLGVGRGFISQASIISAIEKYKIEETIKEYDINPTEDLLFTIIFHYFKAVEDVFYDHWQQGKLLTKSVGTRALFKSLPAVFELIAKKNVKFNYKTVSEALKKVDQKIFEEQDLTMLGGEKGVKFLSNLIIESIG